MARAPGGNVTQAGRLRLATPRPLQEPAFCALRSDKCRYRAGWSFWGALSPGGVVAGSPHDGRAGTPAHLGPVRVKQTRGMLTELRRFRGRFAQPLQRNDL